LPVSEVVASALEDLGRRVAEAVARGEFEVTSSARGAGSVHDLRRG
jgi:hypothetical protein